MEKALLALQEFYGEEATTEKTGSIPKREGEVLQSTAHAGKHVESRYRSIWTFH